MTDPKIGILAYGAYLPQRRLQRSAIYAANSWFAPDLRGLAKGEKAVASWDEDAITMAVEAARDALTGLDRAELGSLSLASTTLPFADRLNSGVVKEALNLNDAIGASDATGSQRCGTSALIQALHGAAENRKPQLCIASDLRKAAPASGDELTNGDASAALLVGHGEVIARFLGAHSVTIDFVDHFRASGVDFDYGWEARWVRQEGHLKIAGGALTSALEDLGVAAGEIDHCVIAITGRGAGPAIAKRAGIAPEAVHDPLVATIGDAGAAHSTLMLAAALEKAKPGEKILLLDFGQGADVLLFEATEAIASLPSRNGVAGSLALGKSVDNYMRYLFHRCILPLERGARAEFDQKQPSTTLYRNRKGVLGLVGGRCTKTGTVQFPKSEIGVNPNDHAAGTQEDYPLAEVPARIMSYTADRLTYSPDPPAYYGAVDFDGGGRITVEFTDLEGADVEVGCEMKMVFRIKAVDEMRHNYRYFWKAAPRT
ncbi:MAG: OB-fold domain-containing protein [Novosphingobium sp.]|nr:OB-fold domain-containing protein [Novosphingobium sp.]